MNQTKNYGFKKPEASEFFKLEDWNENLDKIDSEIKSREDKIEENANTEFTVADKRENIVSKEKMQKILGKIAKFFTDLKTVAFTGNYEDLINKPKYGKEFVTDKSGTLSINLDGTTITLDEAKNVIKLADTLKDKIGSALQPESIVNNQITTEEGFALDARQANPNLDGTLAKQLSDLNGSLKMIDCGASTFSKSDSAINPGTIISTSVTFNKKFNGRPIVIVSWAERNCNTYLGMINVDNRKVTADGFECNTTLKVADSWKYSWIFYWIAIEQ